MLKLIARKLVQGLLLILVTTSVTFFLLSSAGGDAFTSLRDNPQVSPETIDRLRATYGMDRPLVERYGIWLRNAVELDLGESFYFRAPVAPLVFSRFLSTAMIGGTGLLIAALIAFTLGAANARYRSAWLRRLIDAIVLVTASTPRLVLSLAALALAVAFAWRSTFWLAAVALALPLVAILLAQFNESLETAMNEDFVLTARAKGMSESVVIFRHALRAAINPVLTLLGLSLGGLLGGSVIVETILGWPGIGGLTVAAVRNRDIPLMMGIVVLVSVAVWAGNGIAEALQIVNDKRLVSSEID